MTNPAAAPTDSDHRIADAPEQTNLRGSLNGDAAPTVRPVTTACHVMGKPPANGVPATDEHTDASDSAPTLDPNGGQSMRWHGALVGHTICKPETFDTLTRWWV